MNELKAEERAEIHKMVIDLSETTAEGLVHINNFTARGRFEETAELFTDVANSFHETARALMVTVPGYEETDLKVKTDKVIKAMQLVLAAYEGDKEVRPMETLQFALIPAYLRWRREVQETIGASAASAYH